MKRIVTEQAFRANTNDQLFKKGNLPVWFYEIEGKEKWEIKQKGWGDCDSWYEDVEEETKGEY